MTKEIRWLQEDNMKLIQNQSRDIEYQTIVLFDGVCKLCNTSIQFYHPRRKAQSIRYVPLASKEALQYIKKQAVQDGLDSIIVLKDGQCYTKSKAVLSLIQEMKFPWSLLSLLSILPNGVLDMAYSFIAKHRYKIFGKTDQCVVNYQE